MLLFYFSFEVTLQMRWVIIITIMVAYVFMNILVTLYASVQAWLLMPTYRLDPGMHQLLSVLASQLAQT